MSGGAVRSRVGMTVAAFALTFGALAVRASKLTLLDGEWLAERARRQQTTLLELDGNEVRTAGNGAEALEVASGFAPDLVVLDIRMPTMDGYECARRLRELPRGEDLLLVALTGWGQPEHRERARNAGFDGHLTKPLEYEALCRLVDSIARPQAQRASA